MKVISILFLLFSALQSGLLAQWSNDPGVNTILDKPGDQRAPLLTTDGKGGAIVAWNEDRGVFANWVDRFGFRQWGNDGVRITPTDRIAGVTNILSDGQGGAVIVWDDYTNAREVGSEVVDIIENEIFVQRVDSLGRLVWNPDGIGVRTGIDSTSVGDFSMVTSNKKEFIVTWTDDRARPYPMSGPIDFYAQKIDLAGNLLWQPNGQLITVHGGLFNPKYRMVTDGESGFLFAHFGEGNGNTVVERISSDGELLWQPGGVSVHIGGAFEMDSDGQSGAVVAGVYFPGGGIVQIRVQRVDSLGNLLWDENGVVLSETGDLQTFIETVHDGKNGAIIEWSENRNGQRQTFLQRKDNQGTQQWQTGGIPLVRAGFLLSNKEDGIILLRSEIIQDSVRTYVKSLQKIDLLGDRKWGGGITYEVRQSDPGGYRGYISDGSGGIIVVWDEFNFQSSWDVVIQQVSRNGELGDVITAVESVRNPLAPQKFVLFQNYPNPFNPETRISFAIKRAGLVSLIIYDLSGKEVITLFDQELSLGEHRIIWNGRNTANEQVASGIYFYRLQANDFMVVNKMTLLH